MSNGCLCHYGISVWLMKRFELVGSTHKKADYRMVVCFFFRLFYLLKPTALVRNDLRLLTGDRAAAIRRRNPGHRKSRLDTRLIPTAHPEFHLPQCRPFEERNEVKTKGHLSVVFFVALNYIKFRKIFFDNPPEFVRGL